MFVQTDYDAPKKRIPWTRHDDECLLLGYSKYGQCKTKHWAQIRSEFLPDRTADQIRVRWKTLLRKRQSLQLDRKRRTPTAWTPSEESDLYDGVIKYGQRWTMILFDASYSFHSSRKPSDLKDKWRNMTKNPNYKPQKPDIKKYSLLDPNDNSIAISVYSNRAPRDAARKAAAKGYSNILLHEQGTNIVHVFAGDRKRIEAPPTPRFKNSSTIWQPINVKCLGRREFNDNDIMDLKIRAAHLETASKTLHEPQDVTNNEYQRLESSSILYYG